MLSTTYRLFSLSKARPVGPFNSPGLLPDDPQLKILSPLGFASGNVMIWSGPNAYILFSYSSEQKTFHSADIARLLGHVNPFLAKSPKWSSSNVVLPMRFPRSP